MPFNDRTENSGTTGYVGCEKIKAIDPLARSARLADEADQDLIEDCKAVIDVITYGIMS